MTVSVFFPCLKIEYNILRREKEEDKRRQREQKKLQGQLIAEQEVLFGSKPSPMKLQSGKKSSRPSSVGCGGNRRLSLGGASVHQTPRPDSVHSNRATPHSRQGKKAGQRAEDDLGLTNANVRRGLEIGNLPVKNFSFNSREVETQTIRRPFSPISSTASSRGNTASIFEDPNRMPSNTSQMTQPKNEIPGKSVASANPLLATPARAITAAADEENRTPQAMKLPYPCTPSTVSAPMQTAMTPAYIPTLADNSAGGTEEEIEYSFEEIRAGFVLPPSSVKRAIQV